MSTTSPGHNELTRMSATLFIWYFTSWPSLQWPWTSTAMNLLNPNVICFNTHPMVKTTWNYFYLYTILLRFWVVKTSLMSLAMKWRGLLNSQDPSVGQSVCPVILLSFLTSFCKRSDSIKLNMILVGWCFRKDLIFGHITYLLFLKGYDSAHFIPVAMLKGWAFSLDQMSYPIHSPQMTPNQRINGFPLLSENYFCSLVIQFCMHPHRVPLSPCTVINPILLT